MTQAKSPQIDEVDGGRFIEAPYLNTKVIRGTNTREDVEMPTNSVFNNTLNVLQKGDSDDNIVPGTDGSGNTDAGVPDTGGNGGASPDDDNADTDGNGNADTDGNSNGGNDGNGNGGNDGLLPDGDTPEGDDNRIKAFLLKNKNMLLVIIVAVLATLCVVVWAKSVVKNDEVSKRPVKVDVNDTTTDTTTTDTDRQGESSDDVEVVADVCDTDTVVIAPDEVEALKDTVPRVGNHEEFYRNFVDRPAQMVAADTTAVVKAIYSNDNEQWRDFIFSHLGAAYMSLIDPSILRPTLLGVGSDNSEAHLREYAENASLSKLVVKETCRVVSASVYEMVSVADSVDVIYIAAFGQKMEDIVFVEVPVRDLLPMNLIRGTINLDETQPDAMPTSFLIYPDKNRPALVWLSDPIGHVEKLSLTGENTDPTGAPSDNGANKPEANKPEADKPADKPEGNKPAVKPASKPAVKPASKPAVKPASKPVDQPVDKPEANKPEANKPEADKPADKPVDEPVDKPVDEPVDKPVDEPVDKPVDEPVDKPVDEPKPDQQSQPPPPEGIGGNNAAQATNGETVPADNPEGTPEGDCPTGNCPGTNGNGNGGGNGDGCPTGNCPGTNGNGNGGGNGDGCPTGNCPGTNGNGNGGGNGDGCPTGNCPGTNGNGNGGGNGDGCPTGNCPGTNGNGNGGGNGDGCPTGNCPGTNGNGNGGEDPSPTCPTGWVYHEESGLCKEPPPPELPTF